MKIRLSENETLVLRTSNANGISRNNFKWPKRGPVKCPDWLPTKECGNGLHGTLMGKGDGTYLSWEEDALWQVVRVNKYDVINLGGKVKFSKGFVVYSGDRKTATDIIYKNGGKAVIGGTQIVGDKQIATAGDYGEATTGCCGTATAGNRGTATAGNRGTARVKNCGIATAGEEGIAMAGNYGIATAGNKGTANTKHCGISIVGERGIAITGTFGKCRAGNESKISIDYLDKKTNRLRTKTGYTGKYGLEPNVFYKLDENGNFSKA